MANEVFVYKYCLEDTKARCSDVYSSISSLESLCLKNMDTFIAFSERMRDEATDSYKNYKELEGDADSRLSIQKAKVEELEDELLEIQNEIEYIKSHKKSVTNDDGSTSYEIDYAALSAAQSRYDSTYAAKKIAQEKLDEILNLVREIGEMVDELEVAKNTLSETASTFAEVKQCMIDLQTSINATADFNLEKLQKAMSVYSKYESLGSLSHPVGRGL